jgi:hypothetical protein
VQRRTFQYKISVHNLFKGNNINHYLINKELSRVGVKWLAEEDKQLAQELSQNKSYEEIALEHRRTVTGIKSRVIDKFIYPSHAI